MPYLVVSICLEEGSAKNLKLGSNSKWCDRYLKDTVKPTNKSRTLEIEAFSKLEKLSCIEASIYLGKTRVGYIVFGQRTIMVLKTLTRHFPCTLKLVLCEKQTFSHNHAVYLLQRCLVLLSNTVQLISYLREL